MTAVYTPMLEQYREIKRQHKDEILFFRLGDFYEMFFDDAETASRELEITLTSRDGGPGTRVPMCGVPYHASENYIAKLINKGYKVAICEQVENPKQAQGIVRREVVKIITPGTVLSDALLQAKTNNYLVALNEDEHSICLSAVDISTGECQWAIFSGINRTSFACDHLFTLMPSEIIFAGVLEGAAQITNFVANRIPGCIYSVLSVENHSILRQLPEQHFAEEELPADNVALHCISYLLYYLHKTVKSDLSHINKLTRFVFGEHLVLDAITLRNLEVTRNLRDGGKKDTLLSVIDFTKTAMGGRLLKKWLESPLKKIPEIRSRQEAVEELIGKPSLRAILQESLHNIYDFERILTRIEVGSASAKDLSALKQSLLVLPDIKKCLQNVSSNKLHSLVLTIATHSDIVDLIHSAVVDDPPFSVREGGIIKPGYDFELDELRLISHDSKKLIQQLEAAEREKTGIKSLKIGFNKVFGYYIEVTHTNTAGVPDYYTRKQTLANAERYITPELKEFEIKILGAQEKIVAIEYQIFCDIRDYIKKYLREIQQTARIIAELDVYLSLSEAAVRNNYIKPSLNNSRDIIIKEGRHPVVEKILTGERFVPNDTNLNHKNCESMVITGPNMAGKSTYMRQVALLMLLAQTGSFIPAKEASICPVDRIFTRVGANDDLAQGQSTFMVEMAEVANILKNATSDSLIILDEVGRGTSTFDGMSIARSVIEYIQESIHAKTLFSTHYHELVELEKIYTNIQNFSVAVKERGDDIIFLRRIRAGGADKSYGIHVAQLAGLPKKLIERAQALLNELESNRTIAATSTDHLSPEETGGGQAIPISLFANTLSEEILAVDINTITPIEALNILHRLQNQAKREAGMT